MTIIDTREKWEKKNKYLVIKKDSALSVESYKQTVEMVTAKLQSSSLAPVSSNKYDDSNIASEIKQDGALTSLQYVTRYDKPMISIYPYSDNYLKTIPKNFEEFKYEAYSSTLYWINLKKDKDTQKIRLANFAISIIRKYKLIGINKSESMLAIEIIGKINRLLDIPLRDLGNLYQIIEKNYPEYRLYPDSRIHNQLFKQYVSEVYESSDCKNIEEVIYEESGWNKQENTWHYYTGVDWDCISSMKIETQFKQIFNLIDWYAGLLTLADMNIMLPLIIHAHLGYALKLYEDAGYNEQYILTLIGASGSKKTSVSRILFCLFGNDLINFTSTDRAIELELMSRRDSIMVLDDLSSGNDKFLALKLEHLLRQIGDSTGRKKSINGGTEQESVQTRSAVVVTSETDIDALRKSSKLRTLAIHVGIHSFDEERLRAYQKNALEAKKACTFNLIEQYMSLFILYLEKNYQRIVSDLMEYHLQAIDKKFSFARQETIYKMMISAMKIILEFWYFYGMFESKEIVEQVFYTWEKIISTVIESNERRGQEVEPYVLFFNAINQGMIMEGIIAQSKDNFENNLSYNKYVGYKKGIYIVLNPELAYSYVINYYRSQGKFFTEDSKELWNKMYELDFLDVYEQKDRKAKMFKQVTIRGEKMMVLYLNWEKIKQCVDKIMI